ncbi:hypothetical protein HRbin27_01763 [bacterium HR27]|nr:hypothetical protein HRbin27_01763 [bacterium HR27]
MAAERSLDRLLQFGRHVQEGTECADDAGKLATFRRCKNRSR